MQSSTQSGSYTTQEEQQPPAGGHTIHQSYQQVYDDFESYAFVEDPTFKAGLPTIIKSVRGANRTAAEIDEMINRAQWFYFTRLRNIDIPWETYAEYARKPVLVPLPAASISPSADSFRTTSDPVDTPSGNASTALNTSAEARRMMVHDSYPVPGGSETGGLSFDLLAELISEGRVGEVPGIRHIPDELNAQEPSIASMPSRPKPWETQGNAVSASLPASGPPLSASQHDTSS